MKFNQLNWLPHKRIQTAKKRFQNAWRLQPTDRPLLILNTPAAELGYTTLERFQDPWKMLNQQLSDIKQHFELVEDDYIPFVWPYLGLGVVASSFGCQIVWPEDKDPWTRPIIYQPEDIYRLKPPNPRKDGLCPRVLEIIQLWQQKLDPQIPIMVTDIQGPLSTASLIWNYTDFIAAMYNHPKEVHRLLKLTTQATIDFVDVQLQIIKNPWPTGHLWFWRPRGMGIGMSNDLLAVLSPQLYRQFGLPYDTKLSNYYGGICMWSDGKVIHNAPLLLELPNFLGICVNTNRQDPYELFEVLGGRSFLNFTVDNSQRTYPKDYFLNLIKDMKHQPGISLSYNLTYNPKLYQQFLKACSAQN